MKWSFGVAVVGVVVALAIAGPARAGDDATMQIEGGTAQTNLAPVELTSWSFDSTRGGGAGMASSGRAAGPEQIGAFHITLANGRASSILMQASAVGRHFQTVTISIHKSDGGPQQPYLQYKLTDVMVSRVQMSGSGGERPSESLTLNFSKIEVIDHPQTEDTGVTRAAMVPGALHLPPPGHAN